MTDSVLKQDSNTQTVKKKANLTGQCKHVRFFLAKSLSESYTTTAAKGSVKP